MGRMTSTAGRQRQRRWPAAALLALALALSLGFANAATPLKRGGTVMAEGPGLGKEYRARFLPRVTAIPFTPGLVLAQGCHNKGPINQLHYRHTDPGDDDSSDLIGFWLAGHGHNGNAGGGGAPGKGGAACAAPPRWGPASEDFFSKCVRDNPEPSDWYWPLVNEEVKAGGPNDGYWMTVITAARFYYAPHNGPLQRVELTLNKWSPDGGAKSGGAPGKGRFMGSWVEFVGRSPQDLVPGTVAQVFAAPPGMVLGDFLTACYKPKGAPTAHVTAVVSACAVMPSWHPKPFENVDKAKQYGYECPDA